MFQKYALQELSGRAAARRESRNALPLHRALEELVAGAQRSAAFPGGVGDADSEPPPTAALLKPGFVIPGIRECVCSIESRISIEPRIPKAIPRDQLLGLGFTAPRPEPRPKRETPNRRGRAKTGARRQAEAATAPAATARRHRPRQGLCDPRAEGKGRAHRGRAPEAGGGRRRREAKARLAELLQGKRLERRDRRSRPRPPFRIRRQDRCDARHRRATEGAQCRRTGRGPADGRALLVDAATLAQVRGGVRVPAVALQVDPDAPAREDPYSDPAYRCRTI